MCGLQKCIVIKGEMSLLDYLIITDVICVNDLSFLSQYNECQPIHPIHIITYTHMYSQIYIHCNILHPSLNMHTYRPSAGAVNITALLLGGPIKAH